MITEKFGKSIKYTKIQKISIETIDNYRKIVYSLNRVYEKSETIIEKEVKNRLFKNLEYELKRRKITRAQVAEAIGTTSSTASEKLSNESRLKVKDVVAIRNKFFPELTLEYLLRDENYQ